MERCRFFYVLAAGFLILLTGCGHLQWLGLGENVEEQPASAPLVIQFQNSPQANDSSGTLHKEDLQEGQRNAAIAKKNTEATAEYHFSMAQAYAAEGNTDRAIEEYKLTLMFDPDSSLIYARLATEYVKKGMLSAAMETCKEALQRDPKFIDVRLILAGLYSASREPRAAVEEYDRVLKIAPMHEEAIIYKSQILIEQNRAGEASKYLQAYLKKSPESPLPWYYLGRAEQRQDHFKAAVKAYQQALEVRPGFAQAGIALGYLYEEKQMVDKAIKIYQELYDQSQDLSAASRLATVYLKSEKYKEAIPYLEAIEGADPDDLNVKVKLGLVYMELKQFEKAVATFKKILEKNPESDRVHYYLGSLHEETKNFNEAVQEFKKVQSESKLFSDAAIHVAFLLKQQNQTAEAKTFIREAMVKSPRVPSFHMFLASLEEEGKNYAEAVSVLEKAIAAFPDEEKLRYYLGTLYDKQGEVDKSLSQMEAILRVNPENVDALNYIAYTWTLRGTRLDDAEKMLRKALKLRPDNGYIQDSWGWYLFIRGRMSEAVVELEKAAKLKPNESTILEHLGDAYARVNLREKAVQQYQQAVRYVDEETAKRKLESKLQIIRQELVRSGRLKPETETGAERTPAQSPAK
jgi:tetratricopeptide (TPR) repeat protein